MLRATCSASGARRALASAAFAEPRPRAVQAAVAASAGPGAAFKAAPTVAGGVNASARTPTTPVAAPARPPIVGAALPTNASKQRPGSKPSKGNPFNDSNVREVLAALDETSETGQTRMMPAPQIPRVDVGDDPSLTDTQVLRYLETRRGDDGARLRPTRLPDASISLLKPDDTGTRRALKEAVTQNAPVSFAVQLQWAVQPVELDKVPPLAIFSAYTLYTVVGSREGRKWYGLRLGFFSDAISAKQVAYYVRSEFASVAVVPVSPQEKDRASDEDSKKANSSHGLSPQDAPRGRWMSSSSSTLKTRRNPQSAAAKRRRRRPAGKAGGTCRPAALVRSAACGGEAPAAKGGGRVGARERRGPQTLEETLEILGAGELEVDNGNGQTLNDTGVRHLRVEIQKNTPFSRLLERLSERTKKN